MPRAAHVVEDFRRPAQSRPAPTTSVHSGSDVLFRVERTQAVVSELGEAQLVDRQAVLEAGGRCRARVAKQPFAMGKSRPGLGADVAARRHA